MRGASRIRRGRGALLGGCGLVAAILPIAAHAADDQSGQNAGVETVVVTAQKRSENAQKVPVAIQVIDGAALQQQNENTLDTMSETVPDVHIEFHPRSGDLYIRGIGSGENQGFEQSVGMFVDDIYDGRARTTAATFLDIDQVEILKGPQTTYFGNNAIAGALNIITNKPTDSFEADARALYGEYGQYDVEAAAGGPITDTLGVRVAATANGMRGWLTDINTGQGQPGENNFAGRVTFAYRPNTDLDMTLKIEGSSEKRVDGIEYGQLVDCPPPPPFVAAGFCSVALSLHLPTGIDNDHNAVKPGAGRTLDTADYVLTTNYRALGQTFTSVTGFTDYHYDANLDGDGTPLDLLTAQSPEQYNQFSQEFRVTSPVDQPIEYLAGAYFQTDHLEYRQSLDYFFLSPTIESIPPLAPLVPYLPLGQQTTTSQLEHDYSVFGAATWNITDSLELTGAMRGSWVKKEYGWNNFFGTATQTYGGDQALPAPLQPLAAGLGIGNPGVLSGSRFDQAWQPSARLQYQIDQDAMAYFSYTRGFKAGGFNGADTSDNPANIPFAPEHVNAYEVGVKSQWLNNTVLLNLDAFRSDYSNLQVAVNINTNGNIRSLVQNAGSSRSQGVEFEGQWVATDNLNLSANISYVNAYYISYDNVTPTQLQQLEGLASQNLSGRPTDFAPQWTGNLTGSYRRSLPAGYQMTAQLMTFFTSSYYMDGTDDPTVWQGSYVRLDGTLTFETPDGRWALDLIGKNLTDRNILTFAQAAPLSLGSVAVEKEMPRSFAVQVRFRW